MARPTKQRSLRILFVSEFFYPRLAGAEVWAWDLCTGLAKRGHKVTVITTRYDGSLREERRSGVRILRMNDAGTSRVGRKLSAMRLAKQVERYITHNTVDIMHANAYLMNVAVSRIAAKRGIPCVTSVHSYFGDDWKRIAGPGARTILKHLERKGIADDRSLALHVPSRYIAKRIARDIPSVRERVMVVDNWLPGSFPTPRPMPKRTLLFVGSLEPVKKPLACIPVAKRLKARLVVIGNGSLADKMAETATAQHVQCQLMGDTTRDETLGLIAGASMVLIPSVTESFSLVALEAMAQGTPVAGTPVGILPELPVMTWPPKRIPPRLTQRVQRAVRERFDKEKSIDEFERLYRRLTSDHVSA